jgi:hypothetical protein
VHATSSFPFTAPASGVSTLSHLNSIAWVWDSMVSLSSVCHYQDLLMGLPHITWACKFGGERQGIELEPVHVPLKMVELDLCLKVAPNFFGLFLKC